ncbi:transmembrane protein 138 isoform X1 [Desmodus rotundus]|uniref:transmembrane protein 138 isoform X1 n=1 Tax=Desmodus rotundus TaxID=9430 RepID=UPI002380EB9D|nr:transmembrane protein 138 isoform X1 [Desmodus rotundus]XP_045039209.2 transmembrane protein 138 isoform X1 [Desmodus rotundus]XP_045039210.2 transmembrane protein 138 isoform X1 [Desmodus rotundus]XP_045039211.2 transmembrane protein 138 isoform X1 [Desmodus rotundus]
MLQTSNYSLVLSLQFLLLCYDLFVNSFSELLRAAPVIQLVLFIIQDIAILFNVIIIFLMFFNTFVFQAGLVNLLFHKFKGTIILAAVYFALSISLHVWVMGIYRPQCPKGSSQARMLLAFLCFTPSAATHRLHWGNHPLRCLPVVLRTYAGKSLTALSGQMDFKRCLHSRG